MIGRSPFMKRLLSVLLVLSVFLMSGCLLMMASAAPGKDSLADYTLVVSYEEDESGFVNQYDDYHLVSDGSREYIFVEDGETGKGKVIEKLFSDEEGDHFAYGVQVYRGGEPVRYAIDYVVPLDRSQPAMRYYYKDYEYQDGEEGRIMVFPNQEAQRIQFAENSAILIPQE